jgi:ribosomal protein S18 acetylase RimI-like enzyme
MRAMLAFLTEEEPTVQDWLVWVIDSNTSARAVYEKLGFEPIGERQPLPDNSGRREEHLRLKLPRASARS